MAHTFSQSLEEAVAEWKRIFVYENRRRLAQEGFLVKDPAEFAVELKDDLIIIRAWKMRKERVPRPVELTIAPVVGSQTYTDFDKRIRFSQTEWLLVKYMALEDQ